MMKYRSTRPTRSAVLWLGLAPLGLLFGCSGNDTVGGGAVTSGGSTTTATQPTSGGRVNSFGGSSSGSGGSSFGGTAGKGGASIVLGGAGGNGGNGGNAASGAAMGGKASGGLPSNGGQANGGAAMGGSTSGGPGGNGGKAAAGATAGGASAAVPALTKTSEGLLTTAGLTVVSYGGLLNGESYQQDTIVSYNGYQYAAFWNTSRHVVLARRTLPSGTWSTLEFTDYATTANDSHNTISLGITPGDGTLHLAFDHHGNDLHYRKSNPGLVTNPATAAFSASSFSSVTSALVGTTAVALVTYPRFVTEPGGNKMLLSARIGSSGSGDEYLWEYDSGTHAWISIGKYLDGTSNPSATVNAYLHGLSYTRGGNRLHASWCWRETPDASTNHDLFYVYSDDHGRTWKDDDDKTVATSGSLFVTTSTSSAKVWTIAQNRGLINQEHMAVDSAGRVHVLLGHMPDAQASDANFTSARTKSQYFHYFRDTNGTWTRNSIASLPVVLNFRGKLAIASSNNVYAILPDLRIAAASPSNDYATWSVLDRADQGRFFSDPLIDTGRLETEDKLTIYYPLKASPTSPNIYALDFTLR